MCGGVNNKIKWQLPSKHVHGDFSIQSMFKFADIDGTNMSIEFRTASGNVVHIGLDGLSNTFFAEDTGTNIAGMLTFENNNQVWALFFLRFTENRYK